MTSFKIGDRVVVNPAVADDYVQPWRTRFENGRQGTIIQLPSANVRGYLVEWDYGRSARYPCDWRMVHRADELVLID